MHDYSATVEIIDVKKRFFYVFYSGHISHVFNVFFYFTNVFRSTSKSRTNNIRGGPSVRAQKVSSIWMKFGM